MWDVVGGSSPPARGLRGPSPPACLDLGIIPARAGFTSRRRCRPAGMRDHPRSRGVYLQTKMQTGRDAGSSPLARGLLVGALPLGRPFGIIPARAGFTGRPAFLPRRLWDHPRSRGVYAGEVTEEKFRDGSSPLARGLRAVDSPAPPRLRIIPARAGFTPTAAREPATTPDHPRSRGVYSDDMAFENHVKGSSPLARGLLTLLGRDIPCFRIIPARAGFTPTAAREPATTPDHPRSRGVYPVLPRLAGAVEGSSPLARGLLSRTVRRRHGGGIIPARAGFTRVRSGRRCRRGDHPRSRGVYS